MITWTKVSSALSIRSGDVRMKIFGYGLAAMWLGGALIGNTVVGIGQYHNTFARMLALLPAPVALWAATSTFKTLYPAISRRVPERYSPLVGIVFLAYVATPLSVLIGAPFVLDYGNPWTAWLGIGLAAGVVMVLLAVALNIRVCAVNDASLEETEVEEFIDLELPETEAVTEDSAKLVIPLEVLPDDTDSSPLNVSEDSSKIVVPLEVLPDEGNGSVHSPISKPSEGDAHEDTPTLETPAEVAEEASAGESAVEAKTPPASDFKIPSILTPRPSETGEG